MPTEPRATYRVQLHKEFGFDAAAEEVEYLDRLGVSHLYSSPVLQAVKGSTHGYDVVDHSRVNAELGGETGFARLAATLRARGMSQLLDIVPNHMAIVTPDNRWWWDVLENGPSSRYAAYFDVDWDPPEAKLRNTVLLPVLEDQYGRVLGQALLGVARQEDGTFTIRYHDHEWPVAPRSIDSLLADAAERCGSEELAFIADAQGRLAASTATDVLAIRRRHRHKEVLRLMLERLCREKPEVAAAVEAEIQRVNSDPNLLDALLDRQNYRVAFWKTAGRDLGYRRFFDVNTLVGLRVEVERVFFETHHLILGWLDDGTVDGLRIDHPDGMRDPAAYLHRLRSARPGVWVVVEKILEAGESLPESWPVEGTTGYDFMARASALFVDPEGERPLTELYEELTGAPTDYAEVLRVHKHRVLRDVLGSDLNRLTSQLVEVCERHRDYRDHTRHELHEVVRELIVCFPVYRTYVSAEAEGASAQDVKYVTEAVNAVRARRPEFDGRLLDFLRELLLRRVPGEHETEFVLRFQQVTGPAMAKGAEDTAFYGYNRLVSLNEVGGRPDRFGLSIREFHEANQAAHWKAPRGLLATSTHDSKRSEDVRARIGVLSEVPPAWARVVRGWFERHRKHWGGEPPDPNIQYLLYQTLVGAWPIEKERVKAYVEKAAREAKSRTSWTEPQAAYETALQGLVDAVLADETFRRELESFVATVRDAGRTYSLGQVLLKLTCPGVPDIYQGTELWDRSLVDPDNRRPVDFALRRRLLGELEGLPVATVMARADEGLPKLWLITRALGLRRARPAPFGPDGAYTPLVVEGPGSDQVVAFARGAEVVTVVPRFVLRRRGEWGSTRVVLPEGAWRNELTGEDVAGGPADVGRLLAKFPVALLSRAGSTGRSGSGRAATTAG
ncbi:MAG TPA: malto-oligosyltrehalose synthase [Vicinamibacteria bacterium]|nr:malto-oligosyltrehalose synthase [Vicinamibacteria bacterium]